MHIIHHETGKKIYQGYLSRGMTRFRKTFFIIYKMHYSLEARDKPFFVSGRLLY